MKRPAIAALLIATAGFCPAPAQTKAAKAPPAVPPAPRTRAEVAAVLSHADPPPANLRPLRLLLVAGPKTHGVAQHDYPVWQRTWAPLLAKSPGVTTDTAFPFPTEAQFAAADAAIFYFKGGWETAQVEALEKFQKRGGGVVTIHWAIGVTAAPEPFAARVGLVYPAARFRHGIVDLRIDASHPITRGFPPVVRFTDEPYWPFVGDPKRVRVLASSEEQAGPDGAPALVPVFWTHEPAGGGRAFVCIFGHYMWTFEDPLFRLLLLRGIAWAAHEPISRLDALALDGVELSEP
ncbi:MAG: ThuA domain-containing protein [Opitutaceae bacterium]|nr:ThuA domain-containing protein [Opitutaceae bacterium]